MPKLVIFVLISVVLFLPFLVDYAFAVPTSIDLPFQIVRINSQFAVTGAGACTATPRIISQDTTFTLVNEVFGSVNIGRESCNIPIMVFDISSIPDNATPINGTLSINVTASSDTLPASATIDDGRWYAILDEEVTGISDQSLYDLTMIQGTNISVGSTHFFIASDIFDGTTGIRSQTQSAITSDFIVQFEQQLESGKNFYNLFGCPFNGASGGVGCGFSTNQDGKAEAVYDKATSFLRVFFEVFTVPSEPLSVTNTFSTSPDECTVDWLQPTDNGGRPISGFQIERSINLVPFSILVADTGTGGITTFTESVSAGNSHRYRISAINADGVGASATTATSCAIPSIASSPRGLIAFEQPDNDITLDWEVPSFDGGLPIDGYFIERDSGAGFQTLLASTFSTATTFVDITVQGNVLFNYRVSTINSNGTSSPSNEASFTIVIPTGGGIVGSPVSAPPPEDLDLLTQQEFDKALAEAIAQIPPLEITVFEIVIETVVQTFFEFAIVDVTHDELTLNSFLQNERLGIRWSSGQNIVIVSTTPALSPFSFTFEQFPVIKRGSGAVISTDFILYDLQVPRNECTRELTRNCVEKIRYEIPITVNAVLNGTNVSDRGTITINLVEDEIDPVLLIILSTLAIPIVAGFVQRNRGRAIIQTVRRAS